MGRLLVPTASSPLNDLMPHTLSDAETSLILRHLLCHPPDPALVPVINSLHSSLVASRSSSAVSPYSSNDDLESASARELFVDFLGSGQTPEDSDNEQDTQSIPDLQDDLYSLELEGLSLADAVCDYLNLAGTTSSDNFGIPPSLIFNEEIHEVRRDLIFFEIYSSTYFQTANFNSLGSQKDSYDSQGHSTWEPEVS